MCCLGWVISNKNINLHPQLQTMFSMLSLDVPRVLEQAFFSLADRYPFLLKLHSLCVRARVRACACACVSSQADLYYSLCFQKSVINMEVVN